MDQIFFPFAYVYLHEFGRLPKNGLRSISNHSNFQNIHAPNLLVVCLHTHACTNRQKWFFCTISFHLGHQGVILHKFFGPYTQTGSYTSTWKVLEKCSTIPFVINYSIFKSICSNLYIPTVYITDVVTTHEQDCNAHCMNRFHIL